MPKVSKLILTIFVCLIFTVSAFAQSETIKIDGAELKNLLPDKQNKKPLLINFWATWCGPCRVEFPELVEIDNEYREKGLNFVIVSVDKFAVIETRVPEFLQQYEAKMPSYLLDAETDRQKLRAIRQIAPKFSGNYPFTLLFNTNGKLVYQKSGVINAKILKLEIEKVLPKTKKND